MDLNTPADIRLLEVNEIEKEHRSRKRQGWNVFCSRFVFEFRRLPRAEQLEKLGWPAAEPIDLDSDVDSFDTDQEEAADRREEGGVPQ